LITVSGRKLAGPLLVLVLAFAILSGCKNTDAFKAPVTQFRDSASVVIESTKVYFLALNKTERDRYLARQAAEPAQITLIGVNQAQVFDPVEIGVRLRALDQLADYADLLFQLATSDAPTTVKARANDLSGALSTLSKEVATLSTGGNNATFQAASNGAFSAIGDVLQTVVAGKASDALKKAIAAGDRPMNQLIDAIRVDARLAYEQKRSVLSTQRVSAVDAYNTEFAKVAQADRGKLKAAADVVSKTEDQWEAFQTARPADGLEAMEIANTAMVKFAQLQKPTASDVVTFSIAMQEFASTAKRVGDAVKQMQGSGATK
jgi:hypothetical protein